MKRWVSAGIALWAGLIGGWAQLQPDAPWPAFGKDYRNTRRTNFGAPTNGSIRWTYSANSRSQGSAVVAADGTIYFGATNGVHAVRPNGQLRWRWYAGYSAATSTPAIGVDGTVYALVNPHDAILVALNPANGALLWSFYLGGSNVISSPAIGPDGRIYVTNGEVPGGYLYCINPDGTLAWRLYLGTEANSVPCFGEDGTIYVGSARHLNAINPNGTFRWRFPVFYPVQGSVGLWEDRVFFGAWDSTLRSVSLSGVQQWIVTTFGPIESGVALAEDRVYMTHTGGELRSYSHTGILNWRHNGGYRGSTPAVGADGVIYAVGSLGSVVYALVPANGLVRWQSGIGTANWYASPAIGGDGTVYVVNGDGRLHAFGPLAGSLHGDGEVEGWNRDYEGLTAVVQFYQDGELKYEMTAPVNADGSFELTETPVGIHEVKVRIHNSLFGRVPNVHLEVNRTPEIQVRLRNGDLNGDNLVDNTDLLYVLFNYGQHAPAYDLNGDGFVNNADLLIVLFNFGATGE
ncbi:MAG: PQQ-binding-like beta-propeller repeat protein [Armatimonadota bacterium]|nr:PQQ-binding-like beta-propeller repeat protein [Armatimonadota bacterium]